MAVPAQGINVSAVLRHGDIGPLERKRHWMRDLPHKIAAIIHTEDIIKDRYWVVDQTHNDRLIKRDNSSDVPGEAAALSS